VILTNKDLQRLFRKFNKQYFQGRLDPRTVIRFADIEDGDEGEASEFCTSNIHGNGGKILINLAYKKFPNAAIITLGHEMVHISLGGDYLQSHGDRFSAEIVRLWNFGFYEGLL
jgi:hypothetical protein